MQWWWTLSVNLWIKINDLFKGRCKNKRVDGISLERLLSEVAVGIPCSAMSVVGTSRGLKGEGYFISRILLPFSEEQCLVWELIRENQPSINEDPFNRKFSNGALEEDIHSPGRSPSPFTLFPFLGAAPLSFLFIFYGCYTFLEFFFFSQAQYFWELTPGVNSSSAESPGTGKAGP